MRIKVVVCALSLSLLSASSLAAAEDPNTTEARSLYGQGIDLANKGQWGEALAAFEKSLALRPHPVTTYNIGNCEHSLGRYTRSRVMLARALSMGDAQATLPASLAETAKGYLAEIDHLLAHADVTIDPADAGIALDGRPLATDAGFGSALVADLATPGPGTTPPAATFELVVDPGPHVIILSRKGYADIVLNRTFVAASRQTLKLDMERLPATLHISSSEVGAIVKLNGADMGPAPLDILRPAGSYRVVVAKDGFETYEAQAQVKAGEEVNLGAALIPKREPITKTWWFWSAAGVVVAGAAIGTYFATRSDPTPTRPPLDGGNLGWTAQIH